MKLEDCQSRRINAAELARQMGYDRAYVACVIVGRYKPGKKFLAALEKIPIEAVTKKYIRKGTFNKS